MTPPSKHNATVVHLQRTFPDATKEECQRFAASRNVSFEDDDEKLKQDAIETLEEYLAWRKKYNMDDDDTNAPKPNNENSAAGMDQQLWKYACHRTQQAMDNMTVKKKTKEKRKSDARSINNRKDSPPPPPPPQFVFIHKIEGSESANVNDEEEGIEVPFCTMQSATTDEQQESSITSPQDNHTASSPVCEKKSFEAITDQWGNDILHVLPAMIDTKTFTAEFYGMTLLYFLDSVLPRDSTEKMTVLLDVRPGEGWPNPLAVFMVNFVRKLAKMLQGKFPGRLEKLIVYPVPKAALSVFHAMQWVFHAELSERIVLVPGSAERKSPLPKKHLQKYVSEEILDFTEQARIDAFITE